MTTAVLWPEARFFFSCPTQGSFVALKTFTRLDASVYDDALLYCRRAELSLTLLPIATLFACMSWVAITTTLQRPQDQASYEKPRKGF